MAKISQKPIIIPPSAQAVVENGAIVISGPKGKLEVKIMPDITATLKDNQIIIIPTNNSVTAKSMAGLIKALVRNHLLGVTEGYTKTLKLVGTGYRVTTKGNGISLAVGFSHLVDFSPPTGISLTVEGQDIIKINGYDKQVVGQVAANIRQIRPPEPYKGKGIRYINEIVRRKQGKTAAK